MVTKRGDQERASLLRMQTSSARSDSDSGIVSRLPCACKKAWRVTMDGGPCGTLAAETLMASTAVTR